MDDGDESTEAGRRDHVGSLARGLQVMEALARHPAGATLTEVATEIGLTRAAARRLLLTLVSTGYATQDSRRFTLSSKLISVARGWIGEASLWSFAEPFMRNVSAALGESCSAAVLSGDDIVYVARVPGRRILSVALHVGTKLPAYCTSMGRVLLSSLTDDELRIFLDGIVLDQRTPKTVTSAERLAALVAAARQDGYAIVDEELELGLRSIAVPIRNRNGRIEAAINISTQAARFSTDDMRHEILPHLTAAARRIEDYFVVQ